MRNNKEPLLQNVLINFGGSKVLFYIILENGDVYE